MSTAKEKRREIKLRNQPSNVQYPPHQSSGSSGSGAQNGGDAPGSGSFISPLCFYVMSLCLAPASDLLFRKPWLHRYNSFSYICCVDTITIHHFILHGSEVYYNLSEGDKVFKVDAIISKQDRRSMSASSLLSFILSRVCLKGITTVRVRLIYLRLQEKIKCSSAAIQDCHDVKRNIKGQSDCGKI